MFSGIVEGKGEVIQAESLNGAIRFVVQRPTNFTDISTGDSISTNGVCLTIEKFDDKTMQFALGQETLNVTGWTIDSLKKYPLNLERSLRMGDRIHGSLVTGHVETMAQVVSVEKGESWFVRIEIPNLNKSLVLNKGSITFNGVNLTVNKILGNTIEVCLIPETLERTNLKNLVNGDAVTVEYDYWAKAFVNYQEQRENTK